MSVIRFSKKLFNALHASALLSLGLYRAVDSDAQPQSRRLREGSAFTASWSGNGAVAVTTSDLGDFARIFRVLGTGDIGNDSICYGGGGIRVLGGTVAWHSSIGPRGTRFAQSGVIHGLTSEGAVTETRNLIIVTQIPEPASFALNDACSFWPRLGQKEQASFRLAGQLDDQISDLAQVIYRTYAVGAHPPLPAVIRKSKHFSSSS